MTQRRSDGARARARTVMVLLAVVLLICGHISMPVGTASAAGSGRAGGAYVRLADGGIGPMIPNVTLSFVREDGTAAFSATTNASGRYSITLAPGRYYLLAGHPDYEDYNSAPGFVVVAPNTQGTANVFLRAPQVTTVLVVRHGEKLNPNSSSVSEPLSQLGVARAGVLRETLLRSGVTAVYSTNTVRTLGTVKPLADVFRLTTQNYSVPSALATEVLADHTGDVVLVAAHSNTVGVVLNAFGAQVSTADVADFDNLYVLSIAGNSRQVVNLQYGASSTGAIKKNQSQALTLLLVGSQPAAGEESEQLLQAGQKAGIGAIFTTTATNTLIAALAANQSVTPAPFNSAQTQQFADQLVTSFGQRRVVVSAPRTELGQLIRALGGAPFPVIYTTDRDHLILLTRFPSGATRIVPLRF